MSKECPSCHTECNAVWECVDCGRMFCIYCGRYIPFPPYMDPTCPDCTGLFCGRGEKVSRDDLEDPSQSDSDSDSGSDSSSDYDDSSSDYSYSSSYSSTQDSSKPSGNGTFWIIVFVLGLLSTALLSGKDTDRRTTFESPRSGGNVSTPTYTQPRNIRMFENTVLGTYNWDKDQRSAQSNGLEAENQGLTSRSEQSSVPTALPADPPTVRCILSTGVETLISGTECHERSGTIYTGELLTW